MDGYDEMFGISSFITQKLDFLTLDHLIVVLLFQKYGMRDDNCGESG